jgi:regulator of replication initiation timing
MLQNRFSTVQNDATKLAREKVALQNEVADLKKRLEHYEHMAEAKGSNDRNSSAEVQRLRAELQEEREINSRRVAETPQFMQMKKLMQNQTTKIKDLR